MGYNVKRILVKNGNLAIFVITSQITFPMNHTQETTSQEYQSPALRIIPVKVENAICDSTLPGGNEDIGYEDWD